MPNIDFDEVFSSFIGTGESSSILDIYKIIPSASQEQMKIINSLEFYIKRWDLDDLKSFLEDYKKYMNKNKNLNFLSSMNMKSLLKAHTQDELIRGIKVNSQISDNTGGL